MFASTQTVTPCTLFSSFQKKLVPPVILTAFYKTLLASTVSTASSTSKNYSGRVPHCDETLPLKRKGTLLNTAINADRRLPKSCQNTVNNIDAILIKNCLKGCLRFKRFQSSTVFASWGKRTRPPSKKELERRPARRNAPASSCAGRGLSRQLIRARRYRKRNSYSQLSLPSREKKIEKQTGKREDARSRGVRHPVEGERDEAGEGREAGREEGEGREADREEGEVREADREEGEGRGEEERGGRGAGRKPREGEGEGEGGKREERWKKGERRVQRGPRGNRVRWGLKVEGVDRLIPTKRRRREFLRLWRFCARSPPPSLLSLSLALLRLSPDSSLSEEARVYRQLEQFFYHLHSYLGRLYALRKAAVSPQLSPGSTQVTQSVSNLPSSPSSSSPSSLSSFSFASEAPSSDVSSSRASAGETASPTVCEAARSREREPEGECGEARSEGQSCGEKETRGDGGHARMGFAALKSEADLCPSSLHFSSFSRAFMKKKRDSAFPSDLSTAEKQLATFLAFSEDLRSEGRRRTRRKRSHVESVGDEESALFASARKSRLFPWSVAKRESDRRVRRGAGLEDSAGEAKRLSLCFRETRRLERGKAGDWQASLPPFFALLHHRMQAFWRHHRKRLRRRIKRSKALLRQLQTENGDALQAEERRAGVRAGGREGEDGGRENAPASEPGRSCATRRASSEKREKVKGPQRSEEENCDHHGEEGIGEEKSSRGEADGDAERVSRGEALQRRLKSPGFSGEDRGAKEESRFPSQRFPLLWTTSATFVPVKLRVQRRACNLLLALRTADSPALASKLIERLLKLPLVLSGKRDEVPRAGPERRLARSRSSSSSPCSFSPQCSSSPLSGSLSAWPRRESSVHPRLARFCVGLCEGGRAEADRGGASWSGRTSATRATEQRKEEEAEAGGEEGKNAEEERDFERAICGAVYLRALVDAQRVGAWTVGRRLWEKTVEVSESAAETVRFWTSVASLLGNAEALCTALVSASRAVGRSGRVTSSGRGPEETEAFLPLFAFLGENVFSSRGREKAFQARRVAAARGHPEKQVSFFGASGEERSATTAASEDLDLLPSQREKTRALLVAAVADAHLRGGRTREAVVGGLEFLESRKLLPREGVPLQVLSSGCDSTAPQERDGVPVSCLSGMKASLACRLSPEKTRPASEKSTESDEAGSGFEKTRGEKNSRFCFARRFSSSALPEDALVVEQVLRALALEARPREALALLRLTRPALKKAINTRWKAFLCESEEEEREEEGKEREEEEGNGGQTEGEEGRDQAEKGEREKEEGKRTKEILSSASTWVSRPGVSYVVVSPHSLDARLRLALAYRRPFSSFSSADSVSALPESLSLLVECERALHRSPQRVLEALRAVASLLGELAVHRDIEESGGDEGRAKRLQRGAFREGEDRAEEAGVASEERGEGENSQKTESERKRTEKNSSRQAHRVTLTAEGKRGLEGRSELRPARREENSRLRQLLSLMELTAETLDFLQPEKEGTRASPRVSSQWVNSDEAGEEQKRRNQEKMFLKATGEEEEECRSVVKRILNDLPHVDCVLQGLVVSLFEEANLPRVALLALDSVLSSSLPSVHPRVEAGKDEDEDKSREGEAQKRQRREGEEGNEEREHVRREGRNGKEEGGKLKGETLKRELEETTAERQNEIPFCSASLGEEPASTVHAERGSDATFFLQWRRRLEAKTRREALREELEETRGEKKKLAERNEGEEDCSATKPSGRDERRSRGRDGEPPEKRREPGDAEHSGKDGKGKPRTCPAPDKENEEGERCREIAGSPHLSLAGKGSSPPQLKVLESEDMSERDEEKREERTEGESDRATDCTEERGDERWRRQPLFFSTKTLPPLPFQFAAFTEALIRQNQNCEAALLHFCRGSSATSPAKDVLRRAQVERRRLVRRGMTACLPTPPPEAVQPEAESDELANRASSSTLTRRSDNRSFTFSLQSRQLWREFLEERERRRRRRNWRIHLMLSARVRARMRWARALPRSSPLSLSLSSSLFPSTCSRNSSSHCNRYSSSPSSPSSSSSPLPCDLSSSASLVSPSSGVSSAVQCEWIGERRVRAPVAVAVLMAHAAVWRDFPLLISLFWSLAERRKREREERLRDKNGGETTGRKGERDADGPSRPPHHRSPTTRTKPTTAAAQTRPTEKENGEATSERREETIGRSRNDERELEDLAFHRAVHMALEGYKALGLSALALQVVEVARSQFGEKKDADRCKGRREGRAGESGDYGIREDKTPLDRRWTQTTNTLPPHPLCPLCISNISPDLSCFFSPYGPQSSSSPLASPPSSSLSSSPRALPSVSLEACNAALSHICRCLREASLSFHYSSSPGWSLQRSADLPSPRPPPRGHGAAPSTLHSLLSRFGPFRDVERDSLAPREREEEVKEEAAKEETEGDGREEAAGRRLEEREEEGRMQEKREEEERERDGERAQGRDGWRSKFEALRGRAMDLIRRMLYEKDWPKPDKVTFRLLLRLTCLLGDMSSLRLLLRAHTRLVAPGLHSFSPDLSENCSTASASSFRSTSPRFPLCKNPVFSTEHARDASPCEAPPSGDSGWRAAPLPSRSLFTAGSGQLGGRNSPFSPELRPDGRDPPADETTGEEASLDRLVSGGAWKGVRETSRLSNDAGAPEVEAEKGDSETDRGASNGGRSDNSGDEEEATVALVKAFLESDAGHSGVEGDEKKRVASYALAQQVVRLLEFHWEQRRRRVGEKRAEAKSSEKTELGADNADFATSRSQPGPRREPRRAGRKSTKEESNETETRRHGAVQPEKEGESERGGQEKEGEKEGERGEESEDGEERTGERGEDLEEEQMKREAMAWFAANNLWKLLPNVVRWRTSGSSSMSLRQEAQPEQETEETEELEEPEGEGASFGIQVDLRQVPPCLVEAALVEMEDTLEKEIARLRRGERAFLFFTPGAYPSSVAAARLDNLRRTAAVLSFFRRKPRRGDAPGSSSLSRLERLRVSLRRHPRLRDSLLLEPVDARRRTPSEGANLGMEGEGEPREQ
uniref:Uncharacterized protein n=2 Tax=Toxoplasma gondii TaxID=5811 RepID=A0A2T6IJX5_TOXGO|nr:hypothetical protein TGBR9_462965 [Toxoplasma gondii TgCATBr9]